MFKFAIPLATLAAFSMSSAANAAITISEDSGNLAAFSYSIDEASRTINIFETWGQNTLNQVLLLVEGWPYGRESWTVNKFVTNNSGHDWTNFSHELLQSGKTYSDDNDGLSFAQYGVPHRPIESDLFADASVDQVNTRDYINFSGGTVADGSTVWFTYGLTNRRDTDETNPFYLRQMQAAIPEPATWTMLIAGFGLVGAAARRRRATHLSVVN